MLWAIGAILLHVQAVPQAVVPAASSTSGRSASTARTRAAVEAIQAQEPDSEKVLLAGRLRDEPASAPGAAASALDSNTITAFEPGRLVLTPVGSAPAAAPAALPAPVPIAPVVALSRRAQVAGRITGGQQKWWLGLSIAQHSAAAFDAWSTRRAITHGSAQELNPMLKPFAGNRSIYAATQVAPTLLDLLGRRMMTSRHSLLRRTWWLPQALGTAASLAAGTHNLRVP